MTFGIIQGISEWCKDQFNDEAMSMYYEIYASLSM